MLVEQLTSRIQDVINQLEHAMFLSDDARHRLETELHGLVAQRDRARDAMRPTSGQDSDAGSSRRSSRRVSAWPVDY